MFTIINGWTSSNTCSIPKLIHSVRVDDEVNGWVYIAYEKGILIYNFWNERSEDGKDELVCEQLG